MGQDPHWFFVYYFFLLVAKIYCVGKREYDGAFHSNLEIPTTEAVRFAVIKKTDLAPGTEFTVYITAFTSKGEGSQSKHMRVNTPAVGKVLRL